MDNVSERRARGEGGRVKGRENINEERQKEGEGERK